jgi:inhibitor of cysteine peptidase
MAARAWRVALAVLGALGLAFSGGCGSRQSQPEFIYGVPNVVSIEVVISDGTPARVSAVVRGEVHDACTHIASVRQSLEGKVFLLRLTTRRALADTCSDAAQAFEATIPLVVRGLQPGPYEVDAGDVSATFYYQREGAAPQL